MFGARIMGGWEFGRPSAVFLCLDIYQRDVVLRRWLFGGCRGCVFIWTFFSWVCTIRRGTFHGHGYHEIFGRRWLLGGFYLFFSFNRLIAFSFVSESR